jgi:hypothetical protein
MRTDDKKKPELTPEELAQEARAQRFVDALQATIKAEVDRESIPAEDFLHAVAWIVLTMMAQQYGLVGIQRADQMWHKVADYVVARFVSGTSPIPVTVVESVEAAMALLGVKPEKKGTVH